MGDYSFDLRPLIFGPMILLGIIWGAWETLDYFFFEDSITSKELIVPEIEITVKDNVIDTLYIYREE